MNTKSLLNALAFFWVVFGIRWSEELEGSHASSRKSTAAPSTEPRIPNTIEWVVDFIEHLLFVFSFILKDKQLPFQILSFCLRFDLIFFFLPDQLLIAHHKLLVPILEKPIAIITYSFLVFFDHLHPALHKFIPTWLVSQSCDYLSLLWDFRLFSSLTVSYFSFFL